MLTRAEREYFQRAEIALSDELNAAKVRYHSCITQRATFDKCAPELTRYKAALQAWDRFTFLQIDIGVNRPG